MHPLVTSILVTGLSMGAAFRGRHVEVFCPYSSVGIGMVVDYRNDYVPIRVCHRIVAGKPGRWVAKGDTCFFPDRGYVTQSNFIGEVIDPTCH